MSPSVKKSPLSVGGTSYSPSNLDGGSAGFTHTGRERFATHEGGLGRGRGRGPGPCCSVGGNAQGDGRVQQQLARVRHGLREQQLVGRVLPGQALAAEPQVLR